MSSQPTPPSWKDVYVFGVVCTCTRTSHLTRDIVGAQRQVGVRLARQGLPPPGQSARGQGERRLRLYGLLHLVVLHVVPPHVASLSGRIFLLACSREAPPQARTAEEDQTGTIKAGPACALTRLFPRACALPRSRPGLPLALAYRVLPTGRALSSSRLGSCNQESRRTAARPAFGVAHTTNLLSSRYPRTRADAAFCPSVC